MIAYTQDHHIQSTAKLDYSIDTKIEATIKHICILRGHMVVLGAPGASKPSDKAVSSRYIIAETHRNIISKAQPTRTINRCDIKV